MYKINNIFNLTITFKIIKQLLGQWNFRKWSWLRLVLSDIRSKTQSYSVYNCGRMMKLGNIRWTLRISKREEPIFKIVADSFFCPLTNRCSSNIQMICLCEWSLISELTVWNICVIFIVEWGNVGLKENVIAIQSLQLKVWTFFFYFLTPEIVGLLQWLTWFYSTFMIKINHSFCIVVLSVFATAGVCFEGCELY